MQLRSITRAVAAAAVLGLVSVAPVSAQMKAPQDIVAALTKVLTFHVISGKILAGDLAKMADKDGYITAKTVSGLELKLHLAGKAVHVGKDFANVVGADVMASNGVIHVIDKVLLP